MFISMTKPKTYNEVAKFDYWLKAMLSELTTLQMSETWVLIDLSPHKTLIGCRWIFKIKHNVDYKTQEIYINNN